MNELPRYGWKIVARMVKGKLPLAFDIYNQKDVNAICPTITTKGNTDFDHCGTILIFEEENNYVYVTETRRKPE